MANLNKSFLIGRLTYDPELRRTADGTAVATLRMAVNESYTGRDGRPQEATTYVDVEVWNTTAENCCEYLSKGSEIHVEGSLREHSWDDKKTGEKRSKLRIRAHRIQFLDRRGGSERQEAHGQDGDWYGEPTPRRRESTKTTPAPSGARSGRYQEEPPEDDDIPF